jgi:hypothetical protein
MSDETTTDKLCRACNETKPLSEFRRSSASKGGYEARCKACRLVRRHIPAEAKHGAVDNHAAAGAAYGKMTPEKIEQYLELRRQGLLRGEAAKAIGVHRETIRKLRHADESFEAAELDAEDDAIEPLERVAYQKALEGDRVLLLFMLQNLSGGSRQKFRYRDMRTTRSEVKHSGTVELEPGAQMQRILALEATLAARAARLNEAAPAGELGSGIIDAEIVEP